MSDKPNEIEDDDVCEYCEGEGTVVIESDEICECCGQFIEPIETELPCPTCNGTGKKKEQGATP